MRGYALAWRVTAHIWPSAGFRRRSSCVTTPSEVTGCLLEFLQFRGFVTFVEIARREQLCAAWRATCSSADSTGHLIADEALKGREILIAPTEPSVGVRVAFILDDGAPVELLQFDTARAVRP